MPPQPRSRAVGVAPIILVASLFALSPAAMAQGQVETSAGVMQIAPVAIGFDEPWGLAFLPDGSALVTERAGHLWHLANGKKVEVKGLPAFHMEGQGGLLDVMVPRDFITSREVWFSFATRAAGGAATAVGRARLTEAGRLEGFETVFTGEGYPGGRHFGSRLVEAADGTIFVTTGDRGTGPQGMAAQDPMLAAGKVIRLARSGAPLAPLRAGWAAGIHSIGHRNIQGAALASDGSLLTVEHGARGGDEVNRAEAGRNYGWPVITYGRDYTFLPIGEGQAKPGMEQPLHYWDPSIAPSGLMVYSGALVPDWKGDLFTGSLNGGFLSRLSPDQPAETGFAEERIEADETGRVRDVAEAPDGAIWFLSVHDGAVYRMAP
ncbi:PQQ-dependent sugar dehydrogenase [Gemmobacter serpentinus]|uniref:PQQ-dependent sugar dehydrogenase n=1 Tax=Gemmobacter serpentinus TaxID=2652247 RepID=UPI00124E2AB7|nr:PQQ-dependent sugar dehydrogenase [Gemmobacter serpentinus]